MQYEGGVQRAMAVMELNSLTFSYEVSSSLVNVRTGRSASKSTESYLVNTLNRGKESREQFLQEWEKDSRRFLKLVRQICIENFAAENSHQRSKRQISDMRTRVVESLRDIFIRMVIVVSENSTFDLRNILPYPITNYPLSLAHYDDARVKSDKSSLMRKMESLQNNIITTEAELPDSYASIYDRDLFFILFFHRLELVHLLPL